MAKQKRFLDSRVSFGATEFRVELADGQKAIYEVSRWDNEMSKDVGDDPSWTVETTREDFLAMLEIVRTANSLGQDP